MFPNDSSSYPNDIPLYRPNGTLDGYDGPLYPYNGSWVGDASSSPTSSI